MTEEEKKLIKEFLDGSEEYSEMLEKHYQIFKSCPICGMKAESYRKLAKIIKKYLK